jgi:hypothetical protein
MDRTVFSSSDWGLVFMLISAISEVAVFSHVPFQQQLYKMSWDDPGDSL